MWNKVKYIALGTLLLVIFVAAGNSDRYFRISKAISIFSSVYKETVHNYVDEVNPNTLARTAFDKMLASLDPYTNYISEDQVEDYRTMSTGQYGGIGAVTRNIKGKTKIIQIYKGFSGDKAGLEIGDVIVAVDDISITDKTPDEIDQLLRGQVGREVKLTVSRDIGNNFDIEVKHERIKIPSVPFFGMVSEETGYIKLSEFTLNCSKDVENGLDSLKEAGATSIILDLRGNLGGLLIEAVKIVNLFVPKGKEVVRTQGKIEDYNSTYRALDNPNDTNIPVIVLVNSRSASASEIVAGALQDYDRAVIIGEKSFGKGLVQIPRELTYNSQLKVTTAKYYIPSGRCIQAIDYANRREDGSVGKIPDSLQAKFTTMNGREVLDGGGVDVDVQIEDAKYNPFIYAILRDGILLDYAVDYHKKHLSIPGAADFSLSEKELSDFTTWFANTDFDYSSETAELIEYLIAAEALPDSKSIDIVKDMQLELANTPKKLLQQNIDVIKSLLEQQIVMTYYFENGRVQRSLNKDPYITKSLELFSKPQAIRSILN